MKAASPRSIVSDYSVEFECSKSCDCSFCSVDPVATVAVHEPMSFLARKVREQDVVLFGTKHNRPAVVRLIAEALPVLVKAGVTHIGLEIGTDQQSRLDRYMQTGACLDEVEIFHVIDCPEYRYLIESIRHWGLKPVAVDLPRHLWASPYTRDHWMAENIHRVCAENTGAKILVIVGNLHAVKRVEWLDPHKTDSFILGYLDNCCSNLSVYSFVMECTDMDHECDLRELLPERKEPVIIETAALDVRLGVLRLLAAKPMRPNEIADAVIVY